VLREHLGPIVFAVSALTSLMLLNYIGKQLGLLLGKGLGWQIIVEFLLLSLPFMVAMTLPMAVLVSVLYAFSRLASENEITAMRANGISLRRVLMPVMGFGAFLTLVMIVFNDQLLPLTNHRLRSLNGDIARKKPSFALREQIINEVSPGLLFLRTNHLDNATNWMRDVTIYDLSDALRRRTIYADSGFLAFTENGRDLKLTLYDGFIQEVPKEEPTKLQRLYYEVDQIRVKGVQDVFIRDSTDTYKSDREMSVCELQGEVAKAERDFFRARERYDRAAKVAKASPNGVVEVSVAAVAAMADTGRIPRARVRSLGRTYCDGVALVDTVALPWIRQRVTRVAAALAPATLRAQQAATSQDTLKKTDSSKTRRDTAQVKTDSAQRRDTSKADSAKVAPIPGALPPGLVAPAPTPPGHLPPGVTVTPSGDTIYPGVTQLVVPQPATPDTSLSAPLAPSTGYQPTVPVAVEMESSRAEMLRFRAAINQFAVEIHKKFAISFACIVFVLLGAPLALRFPRGGVGLVIGVSLIVFALYYVGLIAGESLANRNLVRPSLAMWGANIIFLIVALALGMRMERFGGAARGGDGELLQKLGALLRGLRPRRRTT
jgi:lipopolysaccharide export system permease protein